MLTEDYDQAQYLSSQVEQARQRAVLAASDSGAARDDARVAEHQAREHAKKAGLVVVNVDQAVQEAKDAADRAEAPTDSMVAELAGNPVSLTRAAVDQATGDMITTNGSTTQTAGDARWLKRDGADIAVASEIERTGSEIQVSGDARWVTNTALSAATVDSLKVMLGAEVLSGALDYAGLQAAADVAMVSGRRLWAAGTLTTSETLVIRSDVDLGGLTINYTGESVAVRVGETSASLREKGGTLPRVADANNTGAGQWVDTRVGIQLVNNDSCIWTVPHIKNFGVGLDEVGENRGHAYNTITVGHLANNKVNNRIRAVGTGWANQNKHLGGRYGHNSGEGVSVSGAAHIQILTGNHPINNNQWDNASLEGNTPELHLDADGTANLFLNCRWEASPPKVRWRSGALNNQIMYGYNAFAIAQTFETGASRNHVYTSDRIYLPTSGGLWLEASGGATAAVDYVMPTGAINAGTDASTGYAVKRTVQGTHMKRPEEAFDRARLNHTNGRFYCGTGTAEPDKYFGAIGSRIGVGGVAVSTSSPVAGEAGPLPATPKGYFEFVVNGVVGLIPYY